MLLRLLFLIATMAYTGPDARSEEDRKMGGEGFGTIVILFVGLGVLALATLVVLAILAMTGQFDSDLLDPLT
ncbi:MAG TPA: hypothetical protein VM450_06715 [Thermomicrobiales bacterium]|jgi:hypothetical protein|nr:hypothetical protein [Thermomicrobiales bacterium]